MTPPTEAQPLNATLEVVSLSALEQMERAQVDMKISTAKKYPRDIKVFVKEAETMISLDAETAESCNYTLKRMGKGGQTFIQGPSIRLLEIAASAYGNIAYGSRIVGIDGEFVTAQGFSHDLQKNVSSAVEVKRSITTKEGRRYSQDMIMVTANAAGAIARRNALKGVVPVAYINRLAEYALGVARGDIKSIGERIQKAFDYFIKVVGVSEEQLLKWLERPNRETCTTEDVDKLNGLKTALKEGETNLDDEFPRESAKPAHEPGAKTAPTAPAKDAPAMENPGNRILELMKKDGVSQDQVIGFCKAQKKDAPYFAGSQIEELPQLANSKLIALVNAWPTIVTEIKNVQI